MKPPESEKLHNLVAGGRFDRAVAILNRLDPVIVADALMSLPQAEQEALFRRLPPEFAAKLATIFPYYHSFVLLHTLAPDQMIAGVFRARCADGREPARRTAGALAGKEKLAGGDEIQTGIHVVPEEATP